MIKSKSRKGSKIEKLIPVEESLGIKLIKIIYQNEISILEVKQFSNKTIFGILRDDGVLVITDNQSNIEINHPTSEKIHSFCPLPKNQLLTASTKSIVLWDNQFKILNILEIPSSFVIFNEIKEYICVLNCENNIKTTFYEISGKELKLKCFKELFGIVPEDANFKKLSQNVIGWWDSMELQIIDVDQNCTLFQKSNYDDYEYQIPDIECMWSNQKNDIFFRVGEEVYQMIPGYTSSKPMLRSTDVINCSSNIDGFLVTGCGGNLKFWTFEKGHWKIVKTLPAHNFPLTEIFFISDFKFITSSLDGSVKEWLYVNQFTIIFVHFTEYEEIFHSNLFETMRFNFVEQINFNSD
jgi:WD40 repeat protein